MAVSVVVYLVGGLVAWKAILAGYSNNDFRDRLRSGHPDWSDEKIDASGRKFALIGGALWPLAIVWGLGFFVIGVAGVMARVSAGWSVEDAVSHEALAKDKNRLAVYSGWFVMAVVVAFLVAWNVWR